MAVRPTLNSVLQRVEQFSPQLAQEYPELLSEMFQRVSKYPFKLTSRGILSHYQPVKLKKWQ